MRPDLVSQYHLADLFATTDYAGGMVDLRSQYDRVMERLGLLLKEARERAGFDQASVEREARIPGGLLSKWENARANPPSLDTAERLAKIVGADVKEVRTLIFHGRILRNMQDDTEPGELAIILSELVEFVGVGVDEALETMAQLGKNRRHAD